MITIRYFAAARELAGCETEELELGAAVRTQAAFIELLSERHPRLRAYLNRMRLALNGSFALPEEVIRDGDEIDVMPPVAGGAPALIDVRETPLSTDEVLKAITHPGAGGVALFVGVVRDHADGKPVARLDYEAHRELALKEMKRVLEGVENEFDGVRLAATHRYGELGVGDWAVVVGASAPHRADAFAACRAAIDRIKETVPIWKKEWGPDGTAHWINLEEG